MYTVRPRKKKKKETDYIYKPFSLSQFLSFFVLFLFSSGSSMLDGVLLLYTISISSGRISYRLFLGPYSRFVSDLIRRFLIWKNASLSFRLARRARAIPYCSSVVFFFISICLLPIFSLPNILYLSFPSLFFNPTNLFGILDREKLLVAKKKQQTFVLLASVCVCLISFSLRLV